MVTVGHLEYFRQRLIKTHPRLTVTLSQQILLNTLQPFGYIGQSSPFDQLFQLDKPQPRLTLIDMT